MSEIQTLAAPHPRPLGWLTALLLAASALLAACHGDQAGGPSMSILAQGITFVPATTTTAEQYRPTVLASGSDVYFSDATTTPLKRVSSVGGTPVGIGGGAIQQPLPRFTLVSGALLVADGTLIKSVPLAGGQVTTLLDVGTPGVGDIVSDDAAVLVGFLGGGVRRLPLSGAVPVDFAADTYGSMGGCLVRVAQDQTRVYWLGGPSTQDTYPDDCGLWSAPLEGGAATLIREGLIVDFALSGPDIFFTEKFRTMGVVTMIGNAQLKRISSTGGPVTEFSASGGRLTTDGAAIFLATGSSLSIAPRSGGPVTEVSGSLPVHDVESNVWNDVSVSAGAVYAADPSTGTVLRFAPVP